MNILKKLQNYLPVGALGISLILHLAIFLGISGIIIIQAVAPKIIPTGESIPSISEDIPPPMPEEQSDTPDLSPTQDNTPDTTPTSSLSLDQISSANPSAAPVFTVMPPSNLPASSTGIASSAHSTKNGEKLSSAIRTMSNPFGGDARQEDGAVVGTMYDLKQTPEGKPTNMTNAPDANSVYHKFLGKFVESGWNETLLNGFYKVEKPLGAFQIFIPSIPADNAPTAFKVEKYVKPKRWIVVYRGSFTSPESGTYRFVGKCDDILAVRLNNKNVLDGSLTTISKSISRETVGNLWGGDWFQLSAGQIYPIQIMIGEEPGGEFYAYLLIQKKGENYPSRPNNAGPILPVFQLAPTNMPKGGPTVAPQAFICQ